jgi:hypothetical protein
MKTPSFEEISLRAYHLWESRGRPDGQEASDDCWLRAERALWEVVNEEGWRDDEDDEFANDSEDAASPQAAAEITNLDRALPAAERRQARNERKRSAGGTDNGAYPGREHAENFLVVLNQGHLRIYQTDGDAPQLINGFDQPEGTRDYTDRDTDQAGRFPGPRGQGGSIDERLPMQEEQQRRLARESARAIATFLDKHPRARWQFAAGPILHKPVLDQLAPGLHARLGQSIMKDLVNVPLTDLLAHFTPQHV